MNAPIRTLVAIRYYRDGRPWDAELIRNPAWPQVEAALRRMDDDGFPIVALSRLDCETDEELFEDDDSLHLIGGQGRYALFQCAGDWQYDDGSGDETPVRLWQSDQGYFCQQRHIADLALALALARVFHRTGCFDALQSSLDAPTGV